MFKHLKKYNFIFFMTLILSINFIAKNNLYVFAEDNNVNLIVDNNNIQTIPKNFRSTNNLNLVTGNKSLNLTGLSNLNISGSEQFSSNNIGILKNNINTKLPITVVDLRQESHGFVNEYPISWENLKNNANVGLNRNEILYKEINQLNSIPLGVPFSPFNHPKQSILPKTILPESKLTKNNSIGYLRITVTDGKLPTDDMVDYFISSINSLPPDTWLHFHCKEGIGRTTTFMIMYDILKNYKDVTLDEIIKRQLAFSGLSEHNLTTFPTKERMDFLTKFYEYVKMQNNSFKVSWSDWLKSTGKSPSLSLNGSINLKTCV